MLKYLKEVVFGLIAKFRNLFTNAQRRDTWMSGQCDCTMCISEDGINQHIVSTGRKVCELMQDLDWEEMMCREIRDLTNSADDGGHSGASWSGVVWWVGNHSHQGWESVMQKAPFIIHLKD